MQSLIRFPTTRWSLVFRAAGGQTHQSREALDELLRRYWKPLLAHLVRSRGVEANEAEDVLQGFIAERVLERRLLASADAQRGKFRTLLLRALECHLADRYRYLNRHKRRGDAMAIRIYDVPDEEDSRTNPEIIFDVEWAREVLGQALRAMRQNVESQERADIWHIFEARVVRPTLYGDEPVPYCQLAERLGLRSAEQGPNLLVSAKRIFHRCLREVIGAYAADEDEVDAEIVELEEALARGRRK